LGGDRGHRQHDRGDRTELREVLPELVSGVGGNGRRDVDGAELGAAGRLDDLGQELREQWRRQPDQQEQPGDDREPERPPRFEQLLAEQDAAPAHAAAPSPVSRPTRRRNTSSSVGRTRSNAARRTPAATTNGRRPAEAAGSSLTETTMTAGSTRTSSIQ